jgi:hypothetical protein
VLGLQPGQVFAELVALGDLAPLRGEPAAPGATVEIDEGIGYDNLRVTAVVDLGFRGVDEACAPLQIIGRGKSKSLETQQRKWLKRRQAIEPTIGHNKSDNLMDGCWRGGSSGAAPHTVACIGIVLRIPALATGRADRGSTGDARGLRQVWRPGEDGFCRSDYLRSCGLGRQRVIMMRLSGSFDVGSEICICPAIS